VLIGTRLRSSIAPSSATKKQGFRVCAKTRVSSARWALGRGFSRVAWQGSHDSPFPRASALPRQALAQKLKEIVIPTSFGMVEAML
jgi:hypothetical protein